MSKFYVIFEHPSYDWHLIGMHKNSRADWLLSIKFQKQCGSNLTWSQLFSTISMCQ